MIQKDKNLQARQNVDKIILRAGHLKQIIRSMFDYIIFTQQSYRSYSKNVFRNLTAFESQISKNCRYQPDKTNIILRLSKQYRQLPSKIENDSQVNLNKIPLISKNQELSKQELQLRKKSQTFHQEFKNYSNTINEYNPIYQKYLSHCKDLDQIIMKFKSYSDPLKFYDKSITSEYQQKLENSLNISKNQETKVTTQLQLLDSKRKFLDELIKEIREIFTHLFHTCLKSIEMLTTLLSDTSKDNQASLDRNQDKYIQSVNDSQKHSEAYDVEFQRLNTFATIIDEGNEIMSDFNDIFKDKKSKKINQQILADHKLFSLRCQNIKSKKQKAFLQCMHLQESLLSAFEEQIKNYKEFQRSFKQKEKYLFGPSGKQSYKKDVELLFGSQTNKLHEFILIIIESPRTAFEHINIWLSDNYVNFKEVIVSKKESINKFNKFYDEIMNEHLKQKAKFQGSDPSDTQVSQAYRINLVSSFDQFKFIFSELEARQMEKDKVVNEKLTLMYKFITKQHNSCLVQNLVQKHKQKVEALKKFKIISQAMTVFKSDSIYNILYEEFFSSSLEKSFQSNINKREYEEAEVILKQKSKIAKKMLKREIGCCGLIKASPIDSQIFSTHKCHIYNHQKNCPYGKLKILKDGLIFSEWKWNPCAQKVYILIPKSDVQSIESKSLTNNECFPQISQGVCLNTEKGQLVFFSKQFDELFTALQQIYGQTYRKSLALDKKGLTRMDSTQSGGQGRASMMVSYNKDQKAFVEEPVFLNPGISRMNSSGSIDKKLRGSNIQRSAISVNSEEYKSNKSQVRSKSQLKQEMAVHTMYDQLILHYEKHQFLSDKYVFVNKQYKSPERKDYEFYDKETHNHFLLKQLKKHQINDSTAGVMLEILYEWKVAYPTNSSLHSFKHGQKILINLNSTPPTISIIEWPHTKNHIFNRHFFYESIKIMNDHIWKYIVQNTNQNFLYEPVIEKEYDIADNSEEIFFDDIKQLGGSFPEELQMKESRMMGFSNDLKIPTSGQNLDFRASNAKSMVSVRSVGRDFKRSNIRESAQALMKPQQF